MLHTRDAQSLCAWHTTAQGAYALACEQALHSRMIAGWPRRSTSLLEMGCASGEFLQLYWGYGFDVTGMDGSQDMIRCCRESMQNRAELYCGSLEHLPFEDGAFDFVCVSIHALEQADPQCVLREAARVASGGILVSFRNIWSMLWLEQVFGPMLHHGYTALTGLLRKKIAKAGAVAETQPALEEPVPEEGGSWWSPLKMAQNMKKYCRKRPVAFGSTLLLPSRFWKIPRSGACGGNALNCVPFGGVGCLRVDLRAECGTPISIPTGKPVGALSASCLLRESNCLKTRHG